LLGAMLRTFVELVQNVVATLWMKLLRSLRDWRTDKADASPPEEKTGTCQETHAVQHDSLLTPVSHTAPSPSVSLTMSAIHLPLLRS